MGCNGHRDHTITDDFRPAEYRPRDGDWQEVRLSEIPRKRTGVESEYARIVAELVLRLSATPKDRGLTRIFDTTELARREKDLIRLYLKRNMLPLDALITTTRTVDGRGHLYVLRGPAFGQIEVVDGRVRRWQMPEDMD